MLCHKIAQTRSKIYSKWIRTRTIHGFPWNPKSPTVFAPKTFPPSLRESSPSQPKKECIQKTTQQSLGRYPNEFSIKEWLSKINIKLDSPLKCKERPRRIHLLCSSNRLLCRQHDISELFREKICPDFWDRWLLAWGMCTLVCYIPLHKIDHWYRRHSDENLRNTSDNWKISQFWKDFTISHVQPLRGFNTELSLITSQTHWVFNTYSSINAGIYRTHLSLYPNATQ